MFLAAFRAANGVTVWEKVYTHSCNSETTTGFCPDTFLLNNTRSLTCLIWWLIRPYIGRTHAKDPLAIFFLSAHLEFCCRVLFSCHLQYMSFWVLDSLSYTHRFPSVELLCRRIQVPHFVCRCKELLFRQTWNHRIHEWYWVWAVSSTTSASTGFKFRTE